MVTATQERAESNMSSIRQALALLPMDAVVLLVPTSVPDRVRKRMLKLGEPLVAESMHGVTIVDASTQAPVGGRGKDAPASFFVYAVSPLKAQSVPASEIHAGGG